MGKKRKRSDSDSDDNQYNKYHKISNTKDGAFWTHNTEICRTVEGDK